MVVQLHPSMLVTPPTGDPLAFTPADGDTVALTPTAAVQSALLTPAGTLATLTITIDDGIIPGQLLSIVCTQIVTALTMSGANLSASILALPTAFTAGQKIEFLWSDANQYWVCIA